MTTLVMVSGSLRTASTNGAVVRAAARIARAHPAVDAVHIARLRSLPLFDEDVEAAGDPAEVTAFKDVIARADALVICTPEYNASVPGVLKNAIDWASRPYGESVLTGKRVSTLSASPSHYGGRWAQDHLRSILTDGAGAQVLNEEPVVFPRVDRLVDAGGTLVDEDALAQVRALVTRTVAACAPQPVSA
jgi:chromate reductase, NAD(P)H dehydrogenase (quinone)